MSENNIIEIKFNRDTAGTKIPFDKLYFVHKEHRHLIPKIFGYAFVLPVTEGLLKDIKNTVPHELSVMKQTRDRSLENAPTNIDGRTSSTRAIRLWWLDNIIEPYQLKSRVSVVPVLVTKGRKKLHPKYITAPKWFESQRAFRDTKKRSGSQKRIKPAVHELAYLATPHPEPHNKISPVCSICPRALQHLSGECTLGQAICYESLDFNYILDSKEK